MHVIDLDGLRLHYRDDGAPEGRPLVFVNSLGTDLRLWDKLIPLLPAGLRLIRHDLRGHGLSDAPHGPYAMGALVRDTEKLMDALGVRGATLVGISLGGLIAQGLTTKRPDLVCALVLSNTAARIGTAEMWQKRIAAITKAGIEPIADAILERWFARPFRETAEFAAWRNMLVRQPAEGYAACCAAIAGTDFYTTTAALHLPALVIAGSEDGSTPPDLVRETAGLIAHARFELIRGAGHLPCVERPEAYAELLTQFLKDTADV